MLAVVNAWLLKEGITFSQYLMHVSTEGTEADGLFVWLATKACAEHINLVHGNGIWTTRASGILDLQDAVIVLTLASIFGQSECSSCEMCFQEFSEMGLTGRMGLLICANTLYLEQPDM